ncbi:ArdC family protein [Roseicella aerolata]|uniref:SsDNA-binding domain-containing protein n=1 Tax=Roseicella aerolata TaxID=2883479 RepID=A0A9X1LDX0_9PROT|nr:ArdC-like ssDNA-binding domain-containing protein [Roseicella aerolata]MCB4825472.1 ssDNA-binding domain-containing protein [Roseicella aerolata]
MKRFTGSAARVDLYQQVTDAVIAELELGVKPWKRPWKTGGTGLPLRHNGEPYRGINVLVLWMAMAARGYSSPTWMTYRQAAALGGQVRKGERATAVTYTNIFHRQEEMPDGTQEERSIWFLKSYAAFNACQIDGLPSRFYPSGGDAVAAPIERIDAAEVFVANTGAVIRTGGYQATYAPDADIIQMPPREAFVYPEAYYATLAHEMGHYAVSWIMPHGRVRRLLRLLSAMRQFGIIRAL